MEETKISIIVTAYNCEKYINKCIDNLLKQKYNNYELIIINDGSTDDTFNELKKYNKNKKICIINYDENHGVSYARNLGIEKCTGKYFLFVDADDYVSNLLLKKLNAIINKNKNVELIKYNYKITNDYSIGEMRNFDDYKKLDGNKALIYLINKRIPFDLACIYLFNKSFFLHNKFFFPVNYYHEDFAVIPLIILKSNFVIITNEILYYYYQSKGSITRNQDMILKKIYDVLYHYDNISAEIENTNLLDESDKVIFKSYIANAVLKKYLNLSLKNKKKFKKEISNRNICDNLINDNILRKMKQMIYKIMIK